MEVLKLPRVEVFLYDFFFGLDLEEFLKQTEKIRRALQPHQPSDVVEVDSEGEEGRGGEGETVFFPEGGGVDPISHGFLDEMLGVCAVDGDGVADRGVRHGGIGV